jgi:rare lipoprotein A
LLLLFAVLTSSGCGFFGPARSGKSYVIKGQRYHILASAEGFRERGQASWYGEPFHGRKTASGEVYDMNKISAAHKTLPLHTWVEVRNLENNKVMNVRINDRGPFVRGRIIDLSRSAAQQLGVYNAGLARVHIRAITGAKARQLAEAEGRQSAPRAAAAPAATPSAGGAIGYGVRALVTASSEEAERHRRVMEKRFGAAGIDTTLDRDRASFSVFIEGLKTAREAETLRKRLLAAGYSAAQIIGSPR